MAILDHRMLHGGDYNPDQWLDRPDILEQDIALMKKAHVNCVSLAIFAWAKLEPEEGKYSFDWLAKVIDTLYESGIYTVLATPSGARPAWMAHKYPEVLRVEANGVRNLMGERHNHCYTSPVYRDKVYQMDKRLSERFGKHPGVRLWHISNEFGGECYCPLCQAEFRKWLQQRYGTLDALNKAWWTTFWSHTYTDWEQVEAPSPRGETETHGLVIDWKRFVTARTVDFCAWEKKAIRDGGSTLPVTTNFMGFYYGLDYTKFRDVLDLVSWDSYPNWRTTGSDLDVAISTAMTHDYMRSIQHKPFLMMENSPSQVNWKPVNRLKAPGQHEAAGLQAIAHGSDSVQYFQWRQSRGSMEKFHGAVVDHYGKSDTRVFGEVAHLGERMEGLGALCGAAYPAQVGILYDRENEWAIDQACGPRNDGRMHYYQTALSHYQAFWRLGVNVEFYSADEDFSNCKLLVAPLLYMYRAGVAERLRAFVEKGGVLVGTYWSGLVDASDLCFLDGTPGQGMMDVFGLRSEEIDGLPDGVHNHMNWQGKCYALTELCELVRPRAGLEVLAQYQDDFYAGKPALTVHAFGEGKAYFLAGRAEDSFYCDFYSKLVGELALCRALGNTQLPDGVSATLRQGEQGGCVVVQNFGTEAASLMLAQPMRDLESGETVDSVNLRPYDTRFLRAE